MLLCSTRLDSSGRPLQALFMQASKALRIGRLSPASTALFICDVQERFRPIISGYPAVIDTAARLVRSVSSNLVHSRSLWSCLLCVVGAKRRSLVSKAGRELKAICA